MNDQPWDPETHSAVAPHREAKTSPLLAAQLDAAGMGDLRSTATTDEARKLVAYLNEIAPRVSAPSGPRGPYKARKLQPARERGLAALLATLQLGQMGSENDGWIRLSLNRTDYNRPAPVSWRTFEGIRESWKAAGLLEEHLGYPGVLAFGNPGPSRGRMSRFRASTKLLKICKQFGVTRDTAADHFKFVFEMPKELVRLTSPYLPLCKTSASQESQDRVAALNTFFANHKLEGAHHAGWIRMFHGGDRPNFNCDYGGRLYSQSPADYLNYQEMPQTRRLGLRIDGEPVVEIDISASYLTIYSAAHGSPLENPRHAYELMGSGEYERAVVKHWFVVSLGSGGLVSKWSSTQKTNFARRNEAHGWRLDAKVLSARDVRDAAVKRYPVLAALRNEGDAGKPNTWGDLMFLESEAIIAAMERLAKDHGIPSAPVHDSILVPASARDTGRRVLEEQFKIIAGVIPALKVTSAT